MYFIQFAMLLLLSHVVISIPVANEFELIDRVDDAKFSLDSIIRISASEPQIACFDFTLGDHLYAISEIAMKFENKNSKAEDSKSESTSINWTQHRVVNQGTWWTPWTPASCVYQNGHGESPVTITSQQFSTHKATSDPGYYVDYGHKAALSSGHVTTEESHNSESRTYVVPAHSYGQVWQQQLMVWQDQQFRNCHKDFQTSDIRCEPWSKSIRGDLPVKSGISFGWSTGWNRMNFGSCGGGA